VFQVTTQIGLWFRDLLDADRWQAGPSEPLMRAPHGELSVGYCVGLGRLLELRSPDSTDQRDPAAQQKDRVEARILSRCMREVRPGRWERETGGDGGGAGEDSSNLRTTHR
jgi:hypothetical protein